MRIGSAAVILVKRSLNRPDPDIHCSISSIAGARGPYSNDLRPTQQPRKPLSRDPRFPPDFPPTPKTPATPRKTPAYLHHSWHQLIPFHAVAQSSELSCKAKKKTRRQTNTHTTAHQNADERDQGKSLVIGGPSSFGGTNAKSPLPPPPLPSLTQTHRTTDLRDCS